MGRTGCSRGLLCCDLAYVVLEIFSSFKMMLKDGLYGSRDSKRLFLGAVECCCLWSVKMGGSMLWQESAGCCKQP